MLFSQYPVPEPGELRLAAIPSGKPSGVSMGNVLNVSLVTMGVRVICEHVDAFEACNLHNVASSSAAFSLTMGYLPLLVLEPEPCPDLDFFQPSFAPIFFHPLPSLRAFLGLVPGDMNPASEVGGVVGGVIGSRAEFDGELALSSVNAASCPSEGDDDGDELLDKYADSLLLVERPRAAER